MNKRIQELLIEAHKQTNGGIYNGHLSEWTEKFAELIVQECAKLTRDKSLSIVERAKIYAEPDADEIDAAKATAWQFLVLEQQMKKHFGVE
jgi:hypothetical protein